MRDRLAARTREREKAQEELRQANAELEARVTARTAELEDANNQLRVELAERRKAEDAVRQSEAKFRAIYDSNTIPIAFWHADGRILEANSVFLNLIQFSRMELEAGAIRWDRLTPAEHLYRDLRAHRQLQAGRSIPPYEKEFVLRDGSRVPVLMGSVLLPEHTDQGISFAIDLTERQRAEAAVRRGEERERSRAREIEALVEAMPAAVWVAHDPLCARVTGNRAAYEMLRMDRGANMSLTAPDAERPKHFRLRHEGKSIPIDDLPVQIAAMKGIEVRDYEFEIAFADGALRHFLGNAAPLLDEAGRPRGAIAAFVDITERRRAQEARERLMAIIEATPDMVSSATLDGRVLYLNKAARDAFGMAEEGDLTNWTISKEHPEWANRLIEEEGLPAALARGVWQGEMAVLDREGRVDRLSMIARDISVRIQLMEAAERRAHEAEEGRQALRRIEWLLTKSAQGGNGKGAIERLPRQPYGNLVELNTSRLLVDAVGEEVLAEIVADSLDLLETSAAIYEKNGDYALGLFTSGWCRRLDAASRALCANDDNRAALASDRWHCHQSCWESASKRAIEAGEPVDVECRGGMRIFSVPIHAGGEVVGALNFGYGDPPRDPEALGAIAERYGLDCDELRQLSLAYESRPPFIIEVAKNRLKTSANLIGAIVEQKLAERRIRELNADLERSIADLRQVNWDLEMFNYSVSHMLQTTLSVIHGYADLLTEEHGERLGDDGRKFADVIRANAEKTEQIIVGLLSLSHIGRQEIRPEALDLKPIVREAMGDLRLPPEQTPELAIGSLPACLGDRGMLRQVLDHLLGNAAKFSRKNPRARIEVGGRPEGDWNLYWVRDNGVGFSMRYVDRLFRAFQRLHREEEFEGTGLGLTAARRIVERHGGRIRAEAQPGQGATFYFTLPKA
jgi:PAS domain S-box-containing protein